MLKWVRKHLGIASFAAAGLLWGLLHHFLDYWIDEETKGRLVHLLDEHVGKGTADVIGFAVPNLVLLGICAAVVFFVYHVGRSHSETHSFESKETRKSPSLSQFAVTESVRHSGARSSIPEISVRELFFYICPEVVDDPAKKLWEGVGREVIDSLSLGKITATGREIDAKRQRSSPIVIPSENWSSANFLPWFLANDDALSEQAECEIKKQVWIRYADLKFDRSKVTSIWPRPENLSVMSIDEIEQRFSLNVANNGKAFDDNVVKVIWVASSTGNFHQRTLPVAVRTDKPVKGRQAEYSFKSRVGETVKVPFCTRDTLGYGNVAANILIGSNAGTLSLPAKIGTSYTVKLGLYGESASFAFLTLTINQQNKLWVERWA
jgi:hypothetical protein